jgi:aconitate hydratase
VQQGDDIVIHEVADQIKAGSAVAVRNETREETYACTHRLSSRQVDLVLAGSLISFLRHRVNPG